MKKIENKKKNNFLMKKRVQRCLNKHIKKRNISLTQPNLLYSDFGQFINKFCGNLFAKGKKSHAIKRFDKVLYEFKKKKKRRSILWFI